MAKQILLADFNRKRWSDYIKQARFNMEFSQVEFGAMYGLHGGTVSAWERMAETPYAAHFLAVCKDNNWKPMDFLDSVYVD